MIKSLLNLLGCFSFLRNHHFVECNLCNAILLNLSSNQMIIRWRKSFSEKRLARYNSFTKTFEILKPWR